VVPDSQGLACGTLYWDDGETLGSTEQGAFNHISFAITTKVKIPTSPFVNLFYFVYFIVFIVLTGALDILFDRPQAGWGGRSWKVCEQLDLTTGARYDMELNPGSSDLEPSTLAIEPYPTLCGNAEYDNCNYNFGTS